MKSDCGSAIVTDLCSGCGAKVVRLPDVEYGSLDGHKLRRVRRLLLDLANQPGRHAMVVDLANVHYFGASFIGILVDTWHQLKKANRHLVVCGLTPFCGNLVRTLSLHKLFDIVATREIALETIGNPVQSAPQESKSAVRIQKSKVAWDPNMVRLEYIGDDDVPIRSVIVPRFDVDGTADAQRP
jgi:anti-anti-sigma factor